MMRTLTTSACALTLWLMLAGLPAAAAGSGSAARTNAIPTCYEQLREYAPVADRGDLTVVIDQTAYLDTRLRDIVQETVARLVQPGTRVSIATFSGYLQGRYLDVLFSGRVEAPLAGAQRDFVSKRDLRQNDACLADQLVYARRMVARGLASAFSGIDPNVERSDILAALQDLGRRVSDARGANRMVIVVSDMLENSSITSFYQSNHLRRVDPDVELRKVATAGIKAGFHGARVVVIGAGGVSSAASGQSYRDPRAMLALEAFWRRWFEASQAELVEFGKPTPLVDIVWDDPILAAAAPLGAQ